MGLAEAAASIPGHEPGHLQNSAGQQVEQSFSRVLTLAAVCTCVHAGKHKRVLVCLFGYFVASTLTRFRFMCVQF